MRGELQVVREIFNVLVDKRVFSGDWVARPDWNGLSEVVALFRVGGNLIQRGVLRVQISYFIDRYDGERSVVVFFRVSLGGKLFYCFIALKGETLDL